MEIRGEHTNLTKEQKDLKKLLGSDALKATKLIEQIKEIDAKFGLKTKIGKRRTAFAAPPDIAAEAEALEAMVEREPITVVCSEKGWLRAFKGHQEPNDSIKYREGDRERFWLHAETTDKLMMFATDGRFFTLDCAKLPGGRGNGEAIRTFIDMPPEADLVTMFVHKDGRKLLLAATSGHGFVTNEDDAVALKRSGKQVMNVPTGVEAASCSFVDGDQVAVVGENRKLLVFPLADVPELAKGRGVILQRYKDGHLSDATTFTWKEGFKDENNRLWTPSELKEWKGERSQAGRVVPRGFAKRPKFAPK
jgi:topoisomerase-4 subunit A